MLGTRHRAKLQRHRPENIDTTEQSRRAPFGPKWKIDPDHLITSEEMIFQANLIPIGDESDHPAYLYRDPRLVKLFCNGVLNMEQLKSLTATQYQSISILYEPLAKRHLYARDALTLKADQIFERVSAHLPDLRQIVVPEYEVSCSSSSSITLDSPQKSKSIDGSLKSLTGLVGQKTQPTGEVVVLLADVALVLSRMPPKTFHEVIKADGFGGNSDWVTQFGQIIHLMPFKKIIELLNTKENDQELFNNVEDGLASKDAQAVVIAYNQILINLANHLNGVDYLKLATLFLENEASFMIGESIQQSCPEIIDQCGEIWSLVLAKCAITGQPSKGYFDSALSSLKGELEWKNSCAGNSGTGHEIVGSAFGRLLINMELEKNEEFLKLWTGGMFDEEVDFDSTYRDMLDDVGNEGFGIWHALFSPFSQPDYATRGFRFMSQALYEDDDEQCSVTVQRHHL